MMVIVVVGAVIAIPELIWSTNKLIIIFSYGKEAA